jgi:hypothetical protein
MAADPGDGQVKFPAAALALLLAGGAAAETPTWKLTPSGWGPARIGMTSAQISKVLHVELEGDFFATEGSCQELVAADGSLPGLFFMFEDGKLTRITASEPSAVATPKGMHIGSTADEVSKAYGAGLKAEPHKYEGPPAQYLTYWLKPERSGVRFEMDMQGKVESIHAGMTSIQYVEGCA